MTKTVDDAETERHRAKMAKRKTVQDAEVAEKTIEKGLLIVHTGAGKGKSTAAFGLALRYEYLDLFAVVTALSERRSDLHVVVTGRNAKPELIAAADLVTEMTLVKHHFAAGVKAQPGIEY